MPAEITNTNGRDEMFYTGKTPWHGLGTKLDGPATAAEAIAAASLDWTVDTVPVYLDGGVEISGKKAVVRADTGLVTNVMSDRYTPLQNVDAFAFFDAVVGAGEDIYHTAGSLQGGRKVWALAKLSGDIKVVGDDVLEKYVLLANSHDGSLAVTMQLTAIRVVCANTMSVALGSGQKFRALHTPNVISKANEAREFLGLTEAYFENLMAGINRLVETKINKTLVDEMVFKVFGLDETKAIGEQHYLPRHAAETVKELFHTGIGNDLKGVKGTAWAAYNAVTEYIDHVRPQGVRLTTARSTAGELGSKRLESAWFGSGAKTKQSAWDILTEVSAKRDSGPVWRGMAARH